MLIISLYERWFFHCYCDFLNCTEGDITCPIWRVALWNNKRNISLYIFTIPFPIPRCFSSLGFSRDFLTASISFYFSFSLSQSNPVDSCASYKFHTLFNILLDCLFLFMSAPFYRVFNHLISASSHCSLLLLSPPPYQLYFPIPHTALLTSVDLFRERNPDRKRNSREIERPHTQT